jgi:hypothetical protein
VLTVRFDDPDLVGPDAFIYAKFVYVSDSWIGGLLSGELENAVRLGPGKKPQRPEIPGGPKSGMYYTRRVSCEVSVKSL